MTPREGVEREAFLRYWGKPSPHDSDLCAVAYAAWLARASLAHPAATAREEAWKAMVEALEQVVPDWLPESASEAAPVVKECYVDIAIRLVRARRALALARSTGGNNG